MKPVSIKEKFNIITNYLFLTPILLIYGTVYIILIKPIIYLISIIFGLINGKKLKNYYKVINDYEENFEYQSAIEFCNDILSKYDLNSITIYFTIALKILMKKAQLLQYISRFSESGEVIKIFDGIFKKGFPIDRELILDYNAIKAEFLIHINKLDSAENEYHFASKINNHYVFENFDASRQFYINLDLIEVYLKKFEPKKALSLNNETEKLLFEFQNDLTEKTFNYHYIILLSYKAIILSQLRDFTGSESCYKEIEGLVETSDLPKSDYADILMDYSLLLIILNKYKEAKEKLEEADSIYQNENLVSYMIDYYKSILLLRSGQYKDSLRILLNIYREIFPYMHKEYYEEHELEIISTIVLVYYKLKNFEKSLEFLEILNEELTKTINQSCKKLTDHERFYFFNSNYSVLLNVFESVEDFKNCSFEYRKALYDFRLRMKFASENHDRKKFPINFTIKNYISKESVIVDILRTQKIHEEKLVVKYFAFLLDDDIRIIQLGDEKIEGSYFNYYMKNIQWKFVDFKSFDHYWAKVDKLIEYKINIYLISEGYYNFVNVSNLQTPDGSYYYEKKNVYLFQNIFAIAKPLPKSENKAVIVANPNFDSDSKTRLKKPPPYILQIVEDEITALPFSQSEGVSINKILQGSGYETFQFYKEEASFSNFKRIKSPNVIHIATHGFNFEENLSSGGGISEWENFTGLLLSNSIMEKKGKKYFNDKGLVYSQYIKQLKLKNTKLCVLSACGSGKEVVMNTGEVIGIQKAFFLAGVQILVVALWEVEDKVTEEFMTAFYTEWVKQENAVKALKKAQKKISEKYIDPFYWAGYKIIHNSLQLIQEMK